MAENLVGYARQKFPNPYSSNQFYIDSVSLNEPEHDKINVMDGFSIVCTPLFSEHDRWPAYTWKDDIVDDDDTQSKL